MNIVSMLRTSPVIRDSQKSTFAFHSCVRNASRSWRAENRCRISCYIQGEFAKGVRARLAKLTSMVMKFVSDLLILRPSMWRWPV